MADPKPIASFEEATAAVNAASLPPPLKNLLLFIVQKLKDAAAPAGAPGAAAALVNPALASPAPAGAPSPFSMAAIPPAGPAPSLPTIVPVPSPAVLEPHVGGAKKSGAKKPASAKKSTKAKK